MFDTCIANTRQKLAGHANTLNLVNLVLCFMSVLMLFSCTFSYTYVDNPKSRYMPTLRRLPWVTLWTSVQDSPPDCIGLGLSSMYSGPCDIPPTTAVVYASAYDEGCQPVPESADAKLMQLNINTCNMFDSCVYSGNWVLGMTMMGFLCAIGSTVGSYLRNRKPSPYSAQIALFFSLATCLIAFICFVSFYHCGNAYAAVIRENWEAYPPLSSAVPPVALETNATLGLGGAGICAMFVWIFFIYISLINFFLGTADVPGDTSEGGGLHTPFADADTASGFRVEDKRHLGEPIGDMREVRSNAAGDFNSA